MKFTTFLDKAVEVLRVAFHSHPTVERYVGQFVPAVVDKISHRTPAIFLVYLDGSSGDASDIPFDMEWTLAFVVAYDDLNPLVRDQRGLEAAEKLADSVNLLCQITPQAFAPTIQSVDKTDRASSASNPGYSYWTIVFTIKWRYDQVLPGDYDEFQ